MADRLLTVNQGAERLSLSPVTLRRWIVQRRIKPVRLGRAIRIRESEIEAIARLGIQAGEGRR